MGFPADRRELNKYRCKALQCHGFLQNVPPMPRRYEGRAPEIKPHGGKLQQVSRALAIPVTSELPSTIPPARSHTQSALNS